MKSAILIAFLTCAAVAQEPLPHQLPPAGVTGDINLEITQANVLTTICVPGYTATERSGKTSGAGPAPTAALKRQIYQRDGIRAAKKTVKGKVIVTCCEVDHLISLELGGRNSAENLWAEPYREYYGAGALGAREKDQVEGYLHRAVCKDPDAEGWMSLADAQQAVATDWMKVYREVHAK